MNRCGPPPEFPLASPYSGIVHHLSGPNMYAHTQTFLPKDHGRSIVHFTDPTSVNKSTFTLIPRWEFYPEHSHTC
eukprot:gene29212-36224_t